MLISLAVAQAGPDIWRVVEVAQAGRAGADESLQGTVFDLARSTVAARAWPHLLLGTLHHDDLDTARKPGNTRPGVDHQVADALEVVVAALLHATPQLGHVDTTLGCTQDGLWLVLVDLPKNLLDGLRHTKTRSLGIGVLVGPDDGGAKGALEHEDLR
eukprot:scaffold10761_cov62-Phaeocystis_antarctica.AAC.3